MTGRATGTILIVDDSSTIRTGHRVLLENAGYEVTEARDGCQALEILAGKAQFDLVITDLHMPGIDGLGLVQALRHEARHRLLPVLMVSGSEDHDDLIHNLEAGVSDFVVKSHSTAAFMARVRNLAQVGQLQRELMHVSQRDGLTGLYRRHFGRQQLEEQLTRPSTMSVGLLDIDHFKTFNDRWGHAAGDTVLKAVSEVLREGCHLAIRWGGEEFLVAFPGLGPGPAAREIEALRARISALQPLVGEEEERVTITISAGLTSYRPGEGLDELVNRADMALYEAKDKGRDQLVIDASPQRRSFRAFYGTKVPG